MQLNGNDDSTAPSKDGETNSAPPVTPKPNNEERPPRAANAQVKKFESGMCYLCGSYFTSVLKRRVSDHVKSACERQLSFRSDCT